MPFPSHIEQVLSQYGVRPDTKEALYELYLILGSDVLEVFADVADTVASPSLLEPEDTLQIRERVIERYLCRLARCRKRCVAWFPVVSRWLTVFSCSGGTPIPADEPRRSRSTWSRALSMMRSRSH